jgi:hypothetical protein
MFAGQQGSMYTVVCCGDIVHVAAAATAVATWLAERSAVLQSYYLCSESCRTT